MSESVLPQVIVPPLDPDREPPSGGTAARVGDILTCPTPWFPGWVVSRQAGMVCGRFSYSVGVR